MDFILELLIEVVIDGVVGLAGSDNRKIPLIIRILAAVIVLVFFGGLFGFLLYVGIKYKQWIVVGVACVLFIPFLAKIIGKIRGRKRL